MTMNSAKLSIILYRLGTLPFRHAPPRLPGIGMRGQRLNGLERNGMTILISTLSDPNYALAPEILLTGEGPQTDAVLAVADGAILFAGPRCDFAARYPGRAIRDLPGCAIVPGFIDAHTHLGQAFGKKLTGGEPSQIWRRIWVPLESSLDAEMAHTSAKWMFLEALRGGFTTINNFAIIDDEKADAIHKAAKEVGIRLVSSTGAAEETDLPHGRAPVALARLIDDALVRADAHVSRCHRLDRVTPSLCVSGVQGASGQLMRALSDFCAERGVLFQIHTNEHHVEVHWSVVRYGKRPLEFFAENGAVGPHTLHHHSTMVTDSEIEILRETGSAVSYNPLASAWKGDRVAPALAFAARGVRFGIGTDSTRSDAFRLLESAETCQRLASGMELADFSCGAAWTWIDAATRGSADVTGLGSVTGTLAAGQRADFLVLDRQRPEVLPSWDFEWELIRLYNRDQIEAVVIDGRPVLLRGRPVGWDAEAFIDRNLGRAIAAVNAAPIERRHGVSSPRRPIPPRQGENRHVARTLSDALNSGDH